MPNGRDRFPVDKVVALLAIGAEPPLMRILVTGRARLRNAEKCPADVFDFDERSLRPGNVFRTVAFVAGESGVLAFERITSLLVVERVGIPLYDRKIFTVVVGMAADAPLAGTRL